MKTNEDPNDATVEQVRNVFQIWAQSDEAKAENDNNINAL
jgi:hypothetical protein